MPNPSLYVHFPLCEAKCTYCDFYSLPGEGHDASDVLGWLWREAQAYAPEEPPTVFLGGGTPTYHAVDDLVRFLDRLDERTGFRSSASEVTVECNPESLDLEKAEALRASGATRLSIGVQSLQPAVLRHFGRVHTVEQSFAAVETARRAGFDRISTDLIYGVPGQTLEAWTDDLEQILGLGLEHLSAYNLTYEPGTALERLRRQGEVEPSDEELELQMFWATREAAARAGLEAYEISNFARDGRVAEHNLRYWRGASYVGIGPSAVSRVGDRRWGNVRNLGRWRQAVAADRPAVDWEERLTSATRLAEFWWLGLRLTEGVDATEARRASEWSAQGDPALELARSLEATGHVEQVGDRHRLTELGLPLADAVARRFIAWADEAAEPARG